MWIVLTEAGASLIAIGIGLAWVLDRRARNAFERTLSPAEREEFRGFRLVASWRLFIRVLNMRHQISADAPRGPAA